MHISDRRFIKQIAQSLIAFLLAPLQVFERPLALEFHGRAGGEGFQHGQRQRIRRHRLVVESDQMPDDFSVRPAQGHAEITHRAQGNHAFIFREFFCQPVGHVAHAAFGYLQAWSAGQGIFEVRTEVAILEERQ